MNSRAAYDEEEVMRRVMEESKGEDHTTRSNGSKSKRGWDDSDE